MDYMKTFCFIAVAVLVAVGSGAEPMPGSMDDSAARTTKEAIGANDNQLSAGQLHKHGPRLVFEARLGIWHPGGTMGLASPWKHSLKEEHSRRSLGQ